MERIKNDRLEVLSSRAGGHPVGAPATREEEQAMATELLVLREVLNRAWGHTLASYVGLHGPVIHPNCRTLTLEMISEMVGIALTQRKTTC